MAFKMNRPLIKGTPLHKVSMAKAKEAKSIVSQRRTRADSDLIQSAADLGKSYVPKVQDYKLESYDFSDIEGKEKKQVKELTDEQKAAAAEKLRKKNLKKEYDKEHSGGTLFPDGKYYDANGNEVKQNKGAKRKEISKNLVDGVETVIGGVAMIPVAIGGGLFKLGEAIVDKAGGFVRNAVDDIKDKAAKGKEKRRIANEKRVADNLLKKEEREYNSAEAVRIRAEEKEKKAAAKLEADKLKQAELDQKQVEKALALERKNEEKLKKRLIREEAAWRRKNKNKKAVISIGKVTTDGIGDQQINQYTKEQRERLNTGEEGGNVWSEEKERYVLPEEIVDGKFVSQAEGQEIQILESDKFSGDNQTNKTVVEEKETEKKGTGVVINGGEVSEATEVPEKPSVNDFEGNFFEKQKQYREAMKAYKEKYDTKYGKSPTEMRDDRIYQFANKNGPVRKNMIKSGYKPR
jgi:hypothetical protein